MSRPAPAAAWTVTVLLVLPLLYASADVAVGAARGAWWSDPQVSQRIDGFFAAPPRRDARRGVMFGISGGLCTFAGAPAEGPIDVLPIGAIGQGFHELYPYVDNVLAGRPDVILVQGTSLVTSADPPTGYQLVRRRLRQELLWPLLGLRDRRLEGAVAGADRDLCRNQARPIDTWRDELTLDLAWVTRDPGPAAQARLLDALARLVDSGIPIVVFDQPRNRHSAAYLDLVDRRVDTLLDALGDRRHHLVVLRYGELVPEAQYFDAVHLTPEGGAQFRRRLIADVIAQLKARAAHE
jgi:hypothetical protein